MPREVELSNNEREFILSALRQNVRLDGRSSDAYRDIELTFGEEYGLVDVKLGKTRYPRALNWLWT
jgi:exosome complex component RRP45